MTSDDNMDVPPYPPQFWRECGMWELDISDMRRGGIEKQLAELFATWQQKTGWQLQPNAVARPAAPGRE